MTRDVTKLLTHEMNQEEWTEFRKQWIDSYTSELMIECGTTLEEAESVADIRFEDYVGQEGYTARNEDLYIKRAAQEDSHKYFTE